MSRPQSIEDEALIERLAFVFRTTGYEGASLALLSERTGLKKASLYHRFPGGKQQMAEEVLAAAGAWYEAHVLGPLAAPGRPETRLAEVARRLDEFYAGGRQPCLLNMLASPNLDGPFATPIKAMFEAIVAAFAKVARDSGHTPAAAKLKAQRAVMLLHGSLVMSRGLGSKAPFQLFLDGLETDLLLDNRQGVRK